MPYVPPHLRNKAPADGADAAAAPPPSGGKSLADLAASAPAGGDRRGGRDRRGGGDRRDRGERTSGERGERNSGERGGERRDNGRKGGGGRSRASAPKAFGTIAGRKTMEPHEDIENGERVDGEGMVYRMVDADESGGPAATYFCDRFRRYRFHCGEAGLMLLAALVRKLEACLELNEERFDPDAARAEEQRKQGYVLYEEKPTLRKSGVVGTWSDEEYGLAGFQWMYLRYKSFQRFAETWALLERVAGAGLLAPGGLLHGLVHPNQATGESWRLVSLGGGPGFELLAADWFVKWWVASGGKVRHPPRNSARKSARDSCAIRAMR